MKYLQAVLNTSSNMNNEEKPIPSPFQFDNLNKKVAEAPVDMNLVGAFIVAMMEQLKLKGIFIVMKTSAMHPHCGDPKCDGYTKVVMNEKFSVDELEDLAKVIQSHVDGQD